ncbi:hypothetical protein RA210_U50090 [Rubrivivax sp. A210]|nr:hypothetical protein RA210_U50090 [Rubrivivax sp. A210]
MPAPTRPSSSLSAPDRPKPCGHERRRPAPRALPRLWPAGALCAVQCLAALLQRALPQRRPGCLGQRALPPAAGHAQRRRRRGARGLSKAPRRPPRPPLSVFPSPLNKRGPPL